VGRQPSNIPSAYLSSIPKGLAGSAGLPSIIVAQQTLRPIATGEWISDDGQILAVNGPNIVLSNNGSKNNQAGSQGNARVTVGIVSGGGNSNVVVVDGVSQTLGSMYATAVAAAGAGTSSASAASVSGNSGSDPSIKGSSPTLVSGSGGDSAPLSPNGCARLTWSGLHYTAMMFLFAIVW